MKIIGSADDGEHITLVPGEDVQIELPETPTTGFRWAVVGIPEILHAVGDEFDAPDAARPGEPGRRRLTFQALTSGSGKLVLKLAARTPRDGPETSFTAFIEATASSP